MSKLRLILLKKRKIALNGVTVKEYQKGEMIIVQKNLAKGLIKAKIAKEWLPKFDKPKNIAFDDDLDGGAK